MYILLRKVKNKNLTSNLLSAPMDSFIYFVEESLHMMF